VALVDSYILKKGDLFHTICLKGQMKMGTSITSNLSKGLSNNGNRYFLIFLASAGLKVSSSIETDNVGKIFNE